MIIRRLIACSLICISKELVQTDLKCNNILAAKESSIEYSTTQHRRGKSMVWGGAGRWVRGRTERERTGRRGRSCWGSLCRTAGSRARGRPQSWGAAALQPGSGPGMRMRAGHRRTASPGRCRRTAGGPGNSASGRLHHAWRTSGMIISWMHSGFCVIVWMGCWVLTLKIRVSPRWLETVLSSTWLTMHIKPGTTNQAQVFHNTHIMQTASCPPNRAQKDVATSTS